MSRKRKAKGPGGAREGAGRPTFAEQGQEARTSRVMANFTATQRAQLQREAEAEGVTVSELVAQRALMVGTRK